MKKLFEGSSSDMTNSEGSKLSQTSTPLISSQNTPSKATTKPNPRTDLIKVGQESLIEIERGKLGLGLSIVGGSDTQLPGIIIHDIYQNGAAFCDKRLAIGDQILRVNNIDLTNATHEQALNALRQTSDFVRLLIPRGFLASEELKANKSTRSHAKKIIEEEQFLNILNIELVKKFAKGLGFSIIGRRDGTGVFLSHIVSFLLRIYNTYEISLF